MYRFYLIISVLFFVSIFIAACIFTEGEEQPDIKPIPGGDKQENVLMGTVKGLNGKPIQDVDATLQLLNLSVKTNASGVFKIELPKTVSNDTLDPEDTIVLSHGAYHYKKKHVYLYSDTSEILLWENPLRLTSEVPGWTDYPPRFATFMEDYLYDLINGGADAYQEEGLVDGLFQVLDFGQEYSVDIFVFNFGTTQNAQAMFAKKTLGYSPKIQIPGYAETVAAGSGFLGGAIIYAIIGKFNVELNFSGYDNINRLKADAALFLQAYQAKLSAY